MAFWDPPSGSINQNLTGTMPLWHNNNGSGRLKAELSLSAETEPRGASGLIQDTYIHDMGCTVTVLKEEPYSSLYDVVFSCLQNSIRHNLSLYDMFVRVKSSCGDRANASYWTLYPAAVNSVTTRHTSHSNSTVMSGNVITCAERKRRFYLGLSFN